MLYHLSLMIGYPTLPLFFILFHIAFSHAFFGTTCFVHNVTFDQYKLYPWSFKCVFMRYHHSQKRYQCVFSILIRILCLLMSLSHHCQYSFITTIWLCLNLGCFSNTSSAKSMLFTTYWNSSMGSIFDRQGHNGGHVSIRSPLKMTSLLFMILHVLPITLLPTILTLVIIDFPPYIILVCPHYLLFVFISLHVKLLLSWSGNKRWLICVPWYGMSSMPGLIFPYTVWAIWMSSNNLEWYSDVDHSLFYSHSPQGFIYVSWTRLLSQAVTRRVLSN